MALRKFLRRFKINMTAYNHAWMTRTSDYHSSGEYTDADPFKIIHFDPNEIKYLQLPVKKIDVLQNIYLDEQGRFDKYRNIGRVYNGDWDMDKALIEEHCDIYRLLYDRFKKNMEWSESEVYKKFAWMISRGKPVWHGCTTMDDLRNRASKVDSLYKNIAENGYTFHYLVKDEEESRFIYRLRKADLASRLNEVTVNIDRDGNFIHNSSGTHRKIIAKLLGIKKIPVRILARHKKWQERRNAVLMAKHPDEICEIVRPFKGHPDLDDIIPESWRNKHISPLLIKAFCFLFDGLKAHYVFIL